MQQQQHQELIRQNIQARERAGDYEGAEFIRTTFHPLLKLKVKRIIPLVFASYSKDDGLVKVKQQRQ